jgi:2,3-bisphosphoglycerate-independent phosphoglycerate mutase
MSTAPKRPKPIVLAVIDGWGVAPHWGGNAVTLAKLPFMNKITKEFPATQLKASGEGVGLPPEERGNSEVGHLNIGAGQIVLQYYPSITKSIKDQSFFSNEIILKAFSKAKDKGKRVHIIGLVSTGGIHSHIDHLFALLEVAKQQEFTDVCIHTITDGRDTPPFVSQEFLSHINSRLIELGFGAICTVAGRYYTMDRDHRWERVEKSYRAMVEGVGPVAPSAEAAAASAYREGFSDEFIPPTVIQGPNNSFKPINDGDSIIFFNFRGDRAREITQALMKPNFDGFNRKKELKDLYFVGFTYYEEGLPIHVAFKPHNVSLSLSTVISDAGLRQLHVAESEKYAHVTYFFNGGNEHPVKGEDRIVVPSPHVPSFDQVPEMSTAQIAVDVISNLQRYDFIVLNFASPDMVGHTGNLRSAIKACETVDKALGDIYQALAKLGGVLAITSDHGNVEQMVNPKTGEPDTEHSNNPVPFILVGGFIPGLKLRTDGILSDVAPTILDLMSLPKPAEMTGSSLIIRPETTPEPVPSQQTSAS